MPKLLDEIEGCIPDLRRYARSLLLDFSLADDLVQDTLERALLKRHLWTRRGKIKPWLFTIMLNIFRNDIRTRKRHSQLVENDLLQTIDKYAAPQEGKVEFIDTMRAIERLSKDQRDALLLVVSGGLSYQDAADTLKVPIGTFMSRLGRARKVLRTITMTQDHKNPTLRIVK